MPSRTTKPDRSNLEPVPGFARPPEEPGDLTEPPALAEAGAPDPPPAKGARRTTSIPTPDPASAEENPGPSPSGPSGISTDEEEPGPSGSSATIEASLEEIGGLILRVAGVLTNRIVNRRRKANGQAETRLWLATETEIEDFGEATAAVAMKRVPADLKDGEAGAVVDVALVAVEYSFRNVLGITDAEIARAHGAPAPAGAAGGDPVDAQSWEAPASDPPRAPAPAPDPAPATPGPGVQATAPAEPPPPIPVEL